MVEYFLDGVNGTILVVAVASAGLGLQLRSYKNTVQAENYRALKEKSDRLETDIRAREHRITELTSELRAEQSKPNLDMLADVLRDNGEVMREQFAAIADWMEHSDTWMKQSDHVQQALLRQLNHEGGKP